MITHYCYTLKMISKHGCLLVHLIRLLLIYPWNIAFFRVTNTNADLFNINNHYLLEKWNDNFKFCTCPAPLGQTFIPQEIQCDADFQHSCQETNSGYKALCELAKRKRKRAVDRHTLPATRRSVKGIETVSSIFAGHNITSFATLKWAPFIRVGFKHINLLVKQQSALVIFSYSQCTSNT